MGPKDAASLGGKRHCLQPGKIFGERRFNCQFRSQHYALAADQFRALLAQYPTHDKASGALLKIGLCAYGLGKLPEAERTLGEVIAKYPGTDVARTADDRRRAIQLGRLR